MGINPNRRLKAPGNPMSSLLYEDEVMRRLKLENRPNVYAQRRALDRLWRVAQRVRKDLNLRPLRRIKVGVRYLYEPSVVEEFIEALSVVS